MRDVLLHEFEQELLVRETEVQKSQSFEGRMGQESQRVDPVIEVDDNEGLPGVCYEGRSVEAPCATLYESTLAQSAFRWFSRALSTHSMDPDKYWYLILRTNMLRSKYVYAQAGLTLLV